MNGSKENLRDALERSVRRTQRRLLITLTATAVAWVMLISFMPQ